MCVLIDLLQAADVQMRVPLRRPQVLRAQQFLNRPQVRSGPKQVCRERMSQCVRTDTAGDGSLAHIAADDAVHASGGQSSSA